MRTTTESVSDLSSRGWDAPCSKAFAQFLPGGGAVSGAAAEIRVAAVSLIAAAGALALASLQVSNGIVVMAYSDPVSAFGGFSPYALR